MSGWRALRTQALVAVAGLGTALWASRVPSPERDQGAILVDCALRAVALHTAEQDVTVERDDDGIRIEVVRRARGETVVRRFRGGERAEDFLDDLEPLRARRSLGELDGEALAEVGLDPSSRSAHPTRWTLRCADAVHSFDVGGAAYGSGDRYVRSVEGGPVVLVAAGYLRSLETAELQLRERRLHRFGPQEVAAARIDAPIELELQQRGRRSPTPAWVDARDPRARRRDLDRLMRAVFQLSASGEEAIPPPDATPVLSLSLRSSDDEELGHLELRMWGEGPGRRYVARTEHTGQWVVVLPSAGAAVARAIERVGGAQPAPED